MEKKIIASYLLILILMTQCAAVISKFVWITKITDFSVRGHVKFMKYMVFGKICLLRYSLLRVPLEKTDLNVVIDFLLRTVHSLIDPTGRLAKRNKMKPFLQIFLLFFTILAGLFVTSDGLSQIVRRPVDVDVEGTNVFLHIPNFLTDTVESKLKSNNICIKGINVCEIQDTVNRRRAVQLIFEQVAEEVTNLLDWLTGIVVQMIVVRDKTVSLKDLLGDTQQMVLRLNICLEFLYDNGTNVTQALDRYLFLRDIMFIYQAVYGLDFQEENILDLFKKKTNVEQLPIGEDVPPKLYLSLLIEAKKKIVNYTIFYNYCYGCGWLNTDKLKWKNLMQSQSSWAVTVQHLVSPISGKSLQQRYNETAAEVDSTKVIAFYAEVAEMVTALVVQQTFDVFPLLVDYLSAMKKIRPPNNLNKSLTTVFQVLVPLLEVLRDFQHFITSVLHLECPAELSNAIADFNSVAVSIIAVLKKLVLESDLTSLVEYVIEVVNVSYPEKKLEINVVETPTTKTQKKIIKDLNAITSNTSAIFIKIKRIQITSKL